MLGPGVPSSQAPRQHATSSNQVMFTAKSSCQWSAVATERTAVSGWRARRSDCFFDLFGHGLPGHDLCPVPFMQSFFLSPSHKDSKPGSPGGPCFGRWLPLARRLFATSAQHQIFSSPAVAASLAMSNAGPTIVCQNIEMT